MRPAVHVLVLVDDLYQASCVQSTWPAVGMVNGHGYNIQQKVRVQTILGVQIKKIITLVVYGLLYRV